MRGILQQDGKPILNLRPDAYDTLGIHREQPPFIDIGDGYHLSADPALLQKYDLLEDLTLLQFVNRFCYLTDSADTDIPDDDLLALRYTLRRLMLIYETGRLHDHLIEKYGAEAINFYAWAHFSLDLEWNAVLRTFVAMPTAVLEEYGHTVWPRRSKSLGEEGVMLVGEMLSRRTDDYGKLPTDLVMGLLSFTVTNETLYAYS